MTLLVLGLALFIAVHMVPWSVPLRDSIVSKVGLNPYKGIFALVSLLGLVLVVMGKSAAPFISVWEPSPAMQHITRLLVLVAFILMPASHMPTNIKRFTRHPMLWGMVFWGIGHLLANGDLASMILFGAFIVYSLLAMVSANARGAVKSETRCGVSEDLMVIVASLIAYGVVTWLHGTLFGYPLI